MVHINENSLGAVIKNARLKKRLTQEVLAEKIGVGSRHIMGIENEGKFPGYTILYKLIRELNISADSIFYPEMKAADAQIEYLICLLKQCDNRDIRAITALVESLLNTSLESDAVEV